MTACQPINLTGTWSSHPSNQLEYQRDVLLGAGRSVQHCSAYRIPVSQQYVMPHWESFPWSMMEWTRSGSMGSQAPRRGEAVSIRGTHCYRQHFMKLCNKGPYCNRLAAQSQADPPWLRSIWLLWSNSARYLFTCKQWPGKKIIKILSTTFIDILLWAIKEQILCLFRLLWQAYSRTHSLFYDIKV